MKTLLAFSILAFSSPAFAQQDASAAHRDFSSANRVVSIPSAEIDDSDESVQMNFINQIWNAGTIKFKNSGRKLHLALLFDVFGNKLYFNQNNQIMEFVEPISEFDIRLVKRGDTMLVKFRNDYPPIQRNSADTYYEVIADGNIQLLKCKAKTIYMHKEANVPEEMRTYNKEVYFAYLPGNKMVPIKKDKADLLKQLPDQAGKIEKIIDSKKLKIKTEQSLKELFVYLNNETSK